MTINPLNVALSGLKVAQTQIGNSSNNIANVSTDGYSKKTIAQYTTVIGNEGAGVRTGIVQRRIDEILLRDYRSQISMTSGMETRQNYLNQIQQFHGAPDSQQSVTAFLDQLKNAFSQLSSQPEDPYLLTNAYNKATQMVQKFSDFSDRITEMRNNTQSEMTQSVDRINSLSNQIAQLNVAIKVATATGRPTADVEDQRDIAVRELAKEVDVSYFKDQNNVLVVMTKNGQLLADTAAVKLNFSPLPMGPQSTYPASARALRLGDPVTGADVTSEKTLGGKLGALVTLRDDTLPVYQAQIDELAHKTALRFESQGLRLFTLPNGTIPSNNPVDYTGFAADMTVNPAIIADNTLIRKGTNPASTVQTGSGEVLRKIVEFAFGNTQYEQITGTVDISNTAASLFSTLGISGQARLQGSANIISLGALDGSPFINPGAQDTFTLQIGAAAPVNIVIDPGDTATDLVNTINASFPGMAQLGTNGDLILTATDTLAIGGGNLGPVGLQELGLVVGTTPSVDPFFEISIGNNQLAKISISSTDTTTQLLAKINALNGVSATLTPAGFLQIRPLEGGDITVIDRLGAPLAALGATESNVGHVAFNVTGVGPAATLSARIQNGTTLQDYSGQAISIQSQDAQNIDTVLTNEQNYQSALEREYLDTSGVNLDEEMANLISIQTAYNASAKTISVVNEMLDELMNTFR